MDLSLIVEKGIDILINKNTGKWIAIKNNEEQDLKIIKKISRELLIDKFGNKFGTYLWSKRIEMSEKIEDKFCHQMNCLVINVTDSCNLKCQYCYANNENKIKMIDSETIIKAVEKFSERIYPNNLTVIFHGGEPLLAFEKIKEAVENLKHIKNVVYSLQTNGTLLTQEKLIFFKKNKFLIGLSIDGISDENNSLRNIDGKIKDYTNKNLEILKNNKSFVKPLIVVHKKNINNIKEIVNFFKNNDFDGLVCNLLFEPENFDNCVLDDSLFDNMRYILDLMMENYDGENFAFSERDIRLLFRKVIYGFIDEYMCMNSPCGAGKETVAVDYKGDVWACNVLISKTEKDNYMGNIFENSINEILSKEVKISKRNIDSIPICNECSYKKLCGGGGCCGFVTNQRNNLKDKSIYCDYHFKLITYMIDSVMRYYESDIITNF
ncbi:MAG: radical SAM protein [Bacilli bacterium]